MNHFFRWAVCLVSLSAVSIVYAAGNPNPNDSAELQRQKSNVAVAGRVIATLDTRWEGDKRPNQLPGPFPFWEKIPEIPAASEVTKSKVVVVLLMFEKAAPNSHGQAFVSWEANLIAPDGSISPCCRAASSMSYYPSDDVPYQLQLLMTVTFDKEDPNGLWKIRVNLEDKVASVIIPVETSFTVVDQ